MASTAEEMIFSTEAGTNAITIVKEGLSGSGSDYKFGKGDVTVNGTVGYIASKKFYVYKKGTMAVTAKGANIDSIKVTYAKDCYPFAELLAGGSTTAKTAAQVSAMFVPSKADTIVTFSNTSGGKTDIKNMTVYYSVVEVPSTPVDTMVHVIVDDPTKCSMKDSHYQVLQLKAGANEVAPGDYALSYPGYNTKYALNEVKLNGVVLQASYNQYYFQSYNNSTLKAGDTLEIKAAYEADSFLVTINTPIEAVVKSAKTVAFDGQYSYTENAVANKLSFKAPAGYPAIIAFENAAYAIDSILVNGVKTELDYNGNIEANVKAATTIQIYAHEKSSAYVKIDNADKAQLRNSSYEYVTLKANEWIQVAEGDYQLGTNSSKFSGYALNKVLLNNKEVADNYGYWSLKLSSNDSLEIVANYAVDSFAVVVTDSVAAVKRAATHGKTVATPTSFKAEAGYSVEIELNTTDYKIDSILINGVKQSSTYSISFSARQETTVRVFAHPYGSVSATLKLADPAHVAVCKGTYFNSNDLIANLVAGENTIEVSENNPNIYIKNNAGCIIDSIKNGDTKLNADYNGGYGVTLTQGCKVEVFSHAKVQNNAATIVVKDLASANNNFGLTNALRENVTLAEGENAVKFADDETPFSLSIYGTSIPNVVVYLNGDTVKATYQYDGGANYSSIALANKDYLEIYVNGGKSQYVAEPANDTITIATTMMEVEGYETDDYVYIAKGDSMFYFDIYYPEGDSVLSPNVTYTFEQMEPDYTLLYISSTKEEIEATDATYRFFYDADSLIHVVATMTTAEHVYKLTYDEKPAKDTIVIALQNAELYDYIESNGCFQICAANADSTLSVSITFESDEIEGVYDVTTAVGSYGEYNYIYSEVGADAYLYKYKSGTITISRDSISNLKFLKAAGIIKCNGAYIDLTLTTEPDPLPKNVLVTKDMYKTWEGFDLSAKATAAAPYWDAVEFGTEASNGGVLYGNSSVLNSTYADLTGYQTLTIFGKCSAPIRVLFNRQADNSNKEINPSIDSTGMVTIDLTQYEYFHLNAIKANWGNTATIDSMVLNYVPMMTGTIEVSNITATGATIDVTPSDTVSTYYWDCLKKETYDNVVAGKYAGYGYGDIQSYMKYILDYYVAVYGYTYEDLASVGPDSYTYKKLSEDTEYVVVALQMDATTGECYAPFATEGFKTRSSIFTCAEAIEARTAGDLADNDSIKVTGYISNMFLKPANFAKYGSVCIWLTDTIGGTAKEFELYNCYGIQGDTLASFGPDFTTTGSSNIDVQYVVGRDGTKVSLGNKVVAAGKIKKYNSTYELNSGCYLVSVDTTTTAIEEIKSMNNKFEGKALINKQVVIRRNNKSYNLNGMIVE